MSEKIEELKELIDSLQPDLIMLLRYVESNDLDGVSIYRDSIQNTMNEIMVIINE